MEKVNYKPFDLEKAKAGAKVRTRNGHEVKFFKFNLRGVYPIAGYVQYEEEELDDVKQWTEDGLYDFENYGNPLDLVMCPEKHEGWVNLYKMEEGTIMAGVVSKTEYEAKESHSNLGQYINTIKIEWEE